MIEYFLSNMWQVWAVVAVICLILELSSGDFFIICFSIVCPHFGSSRLEHLLADIHLRHLLAAQRHIRPSSSPALAA